MNINTDKILELESGKIYFANFKDHSEDIPEFIKALKDNNIKCLITVGEIVFEDIVDTVRQLPIEYQKKIHEDWAARKKRLEINFED